MDCGIPFCHQGCPLGNLIPEWNDLVHRGRMDDARARLAETNNFPEVTSPLVPKIPARRTGKRVAVVGSGPAGLACAQELARAGHEVHVYERDDRIGGLLRYGIPDFKLEKHPIDRRMEQMEAEGVTFHPGVNATGAALRARHDAIVLALGARAPRDLDSAGRDLDGVHFAMEFLVQQNRRVAAATPGPTASGLRSATVRPACSSSS
jgi:glutamate synthase (NADPH/NADH) small chain